MKKNLNIKSDINMRTKLVIFSELLILFLFISSSIAMADTGSSETIKVSDIQKNTIKQTAVSLNFELAPDNPEFIEYLKNKEISLKGQSLEGQYTGYIPSPMDLSHVSKISAAYESAQDYPAYYDLRALNKVTPVKFQDDAGVCWIFATYASLESYLMPNESWDFSENNMKNLLSSSYLDGFDRDANSGGTFVMSTAYLTRWSGPVNESDDPYDPHSVASPQNLTIQKHVQDVLFLSSRQNSSDNKEIKFAIMNYGAVASMIYIDGNYPPQYLPAKYSYYYNGSLNANHGITIVGWDDNFDRNNFSSVPPGDGAFIVKNSWNTSWGDRGYFYISYYDSNIGKASAIYIAESPNNYKYIYQYDPLGWSQSIGQPNKNMWCANVFTAQSNEVLKAVSFYATDPNCNYEIRILNSTSSKILNSTTLNSTSSVLTQNGTIPTAGYHTVKLNYGVKLKAGENFSVNLNLTTPQNSPIALEYPTAVYSSHATANPRESFVSTNGNTWIDITTIYPNTNVCIKAFTDPETVPPVADFSATPTSGNAPLNVSFTDKSTGTPTSWAWDFGDGNTSTDQNSTNIYSTAGNYTVKITVSNAAGSDNKTIEDCVQVLPKVLDTQAPVINSVSLNNSNPNTGDLIKVTVNATDNVAVTSVEASDSSLSSLGENIWEGTITALEGIHFVNVSAEDAAGNITWNNSTSYTATSSDIEFHFIKSLGGSGGEYAQSIQQTSDGGYIVAGDSNSNDGNVTGNHGGSDYWVVKLDTTGNIVWQKSLGGSSYDNAYSIQQTSDGGYIVAGESNSNDGDVTGNHGGFDYWVVKLDTTGNIVWQKSLGGSGGELAESIQQTSDGGYIVAGYSRSTDGDVTGNHGGYDYWVVKLDTTGNIVWQKSLGGSDHDYAYSIQQTSDGGYIVAGDSRSNDGDVTGNHGGYDSWVVKLDTTGNIVWQKCLGGSISDNAYSIQQTSDGGYIVAGYSGSTDGDVTGNHGEFDYWVVKLDTTGNIVWQKSLGGSDDEYAESIQQTSDGGYIVAGESNSNDGDVTGNHGESDYWVVKLDTTGNIVWQKSLGGSDWDDAYSIQQTSDGGYIVAGESDSNDGDVTGNHGGYDYWVVKFAPQTRIPVANFTSNVTEGYAPLDVQFNDTSTGTPTSWQWNFGDGSANSTEQNATHTFTDVGIYHVTLTVAEDGNNSTITKDITVLNAPVAADFTSNVTIGTVPLSVHFYDASTGSPTSWQWNFGDGSPNSTERDPPHTFTDIGVFHVTLTVMKDGASSSKTKAITVNAPIGFKQYAYITNAVSSSVSVIDIATNTVVATVPIESYPEGVAVSPTRKNVYITSPGSDTVSVIDTITNNVTATINVGWYPWGVAVTPDGKKVYVANQLSNDVSVIDAKTNNVTTTINFVQDPYGVAVKPDGKKVYVTNGGNVSVIDTKTNTVKTTINLGYEPEGIAFTPDGKTAYVANYGNSSFSVIDTELDTVSTTVPLGPLGNPIAVAIPAFGKQVYMTNINWDTVSVINMDTNSVTSTVKVGRFPEGVAATSDGTKVYVANWLSNNVSVIDTKNNTVIATVPVGSRPVAFGQFITPVPVNGEADLSLSLQAPVSEFPSTSMTYTLCYQNFGTISANNVLLEDELSDVVSFKSASDGGVYDPSTRKVTWDIGTLGPSDHGYRYITVMTPLDVIVGTKIPNSASISTSDLEGQYEDNDQQVQTRITLPDLPPNVSVVNPHLWGISTPVVWWFEPTTFSYHSCQDATAVGINIHIDDGGQDIVANMAGGPPDWNYTTTFHPRYGKATVTYTISGCTPEIVSFDIYIDPAGYIYDIDTGKRISGASVWLQRPDGNGGWENVPTGENPPVSQPDINPLISDQNGM
ncbi:MAG: PKD domain-containing protein, partial [Methanosarcina sp.]|nr:PKD domain-containing protein [Methanosarcina sp.]